MFSIIDCGTTNTRVYILDELNNIIAKGYKKVGVRDTAITGSNRVLKDGIKEAFNMALNEGNINISQIEYAIASGMITSEIGLLEIPHLIAPAGLDDLADNIKVVHDTDIFPINIPVIFIRGIKNNYGGVSLKGIRNIDFMRGEETQIIGMIDWLKPVLPINVIVLSSHTKLIHVNRDAKISGSITTLSGQIYEAIKKETSIGKCIDVENPEKYEDFFSEDILKTVKDSIDNTGFLRTMLMPRFMQVLLETEWYERKFFADSSIALEDMKIFNDAKNLLGFDMNTDFVLVGHRERCRIYDYLIKSEPGFNKNVRSIWDKDEIDMLAINGAIKIAGKSKELAKK